MIDRKHIYMDYSTHIHLEKTSFATPSTDCTHGRLRGIALQLCYR